MASDRSSAALDLQTPPGGTVAIMRPIDFQSLPIWTNGAVFVAAAVVVWLAGTRLAHYVDAVGRRTELSQAFLGMVLLGVATSLPELATTVTGSLIGNAQLVTGNLFGGVSLQIAVLALVDLVAVKGALTYVTPQPVLLFQGVMLILLLAVALAGAAVGEPLSILGLGMTPIILAVGYAITVRATGTGKYLPRWRPEGDVDDIGPEASEGSNGIERLSSRALYLRCAIAALTILLAGWGLTLTGEALAEQTGLGASFVGVALVAASTSLPELSTTLAAVRRGNHEMAVSNILGTNCLEVALFLVADLAYRDGPILAATDQSGMLAASIGLIVTCLLLLGLLERRDRTVARMGLDSFAVLVTYGIGLAGLYHLR
jgi:cation:H+ antiporter